MLDILTARGQETLAQEREAASLFCATFKGFGYISTPKSEPCAIDAVLSREGDIVAAVETKCRQTTLEEFTGTYNSLWLITDKKLKDAAEMAGLLCVPLYGFLYLVPSRTLLVRRLWHREWCVPITTKETTTQATVNGGTALRLNAYVDMRDAKVITAPQ